MPFSSYFPFDTLEAGVALPNRFKPTPNNPVDPPNVKASKKGPEAAHLLVPHDSAEKDVLHKIDLSTALQYGTAQGYPSLYSFVRGFVQINMHPNIPYDGGAEVILTCGSTDGFSKILECFTNIWDEERDWIRDREGVLCEEFAYMNAIQTAAPRGLNIVTVKVDDEGMLAHGPGGLADVLDNWDVYRGKRPHIIYTVTMGQNPTSGLLSIKRRKEIYAICQKYDVLIAEDDPYWFLQFPSANESSVKARGHAVSENHPLEPYNYNTANGGKSSGFDFLDSLVPSYLSIDVDGRVIRMDTFSKCVAPGARLGWLTAQPKVVETIQRITETSTQQPSGFVQSVIAELLAGPSDTADDPGKGGSKDGSGWKVDGWVRWLEGLRGNYERRMQTMASALEEGRYLVRQSTNAEGFEEVSKTQIYDFNYPMAGMFLWLRCHFDTHPLYTEPHLLGSHNFTGPDLSRAFWLFQTKPKYRVLAAPGQMFAPSPAVSEESAWQYFRLCFAAVDEAIVKSSSENFVESARDFWKLTAKEVQELLDELAAPAPPDAAEAMAMSQVSLQMPEPVIVLILNRRSTRSIRLFANRREKFASIERILYTVRMNR
jgi:DNA-binding transcriptional MocR family regulator